jgi:predicted cobalt transporter CbtA
MVSVFRGHRHLYLLLMFVTFAPTIGQPPELAAAELSGIERGRKFWAEPVFMAAALLAINAIAVRSSLCKSADGTVGLCAIYCDACQSGSG